MSFKTGDKVRVITKNSTYEGRTGTVVHVFEDGRTVTVTFDPASGMISGFFNHELELVDEKREALIELAETLDLARKQANASGNYVIESQSGVYGTVALALHDTLEQIVGNDYGDSTEADRIYQSILDGNNVREAIASVKRD